VVSLEDFDRYCQEHNVQPGQHGAAFAQWLAETTGAPVPRFEKVEPEPPADGVVIEGDDLQGTSGARFTQCDPRPRLRLSLGRRASHAQRPFRTSPRKPRRVSLVRRRRLDDRHRTARRRNRDYFRASRHQAAS
jgi:hypothetical protein